MRFQRFLFAALVMVMTFAASGPLRGQTSWLRLADNGGMPRPGIEPSVLYDSSTGAFVMWYIDNAANSIRRAVSLDGESWYEADTIALSANPEGAYDRQLHAVNVVRFNGEYLMYYTSSRDLDTIVICAARSTDGIRWEKVESGPVLKPKPGSWDSWRVHGCKVLARNGALFMWHSGSDGLYRNTGLALSDDGITWARHSDSPVLSRGGAGALDEQEACVAAVTERDEKFYLLYRAISGSSVHSYALAVSTDGMAWWKYPMNPALARTAQDMFLGGGCMLWQAPWFRLWYTSASSDYSSAWSIKTALAEAVVLSSESDLGVLPTTPVLKQNFPNPFNPATAVTFVAPSSGEYYLAVYDMLGREVEVLVNGRLDAGQHTVTFDGSGKASGVYVYQLRCAEQVLARTMTLVR